MLAAALLAAAAPAPTPAKLEMEVWKAFQAKRVGEIKSMFSPDFVGLYADGTHDLARELQSLNEITIKDYKLTPMRSRALDSDDVLLTYGADARLLVGKKVIPTRLWMASLWHREGGRWLCVYHSEIKAK
ncbi:MAG TPA: nuclear transport factor 2 family protein [Sphingomicrobium sp.]|jgi:hypothetical protein|nr:nuclear transport factor 2 family protein [Sphingomicrobium sp.]